MFPEAQAKAQAEIDDVVGTGRLPDFDDYESLPYVVAITKEIMRWQLVLPLGVFDFFYSIITPIVDLQIGTAHACTTDDKYDGFHIPAGSIVVGSSWCVYLKFRGPYSAFACFPSGLFFITQKRTLIPNRLTQNASSKTVG